MRYFLRILALVLWLGTTCALAIEVGNTLTLGSMKTIDGRVIPAKRWSERYTIVQVWASWCPYCKAQNVHLQELMGRVSPDTLNIITISIDKSVEPVRAYLQKNQYTFDVVMMSPDLARAIGKRKGVPEVYVLNPKGEVVQKDYGQMIDWDFYDLAKYATPQPLPKK